ncbi:hypothetical protein [Demequina globuliformis]|uniref:hypothetical protein n=1 Tax=Demequina globuliformis TaxID=676202 RepID=UPI000781591C|nr:hypothetical protein [Demequina globuliformis]
MSDKLANALQSVKRAHGDNDPYWRAEVVSVDEDARRIEVAAGESTIVIPAVGFIGDYAPGQTAYITRDPAGPVALGSIGIARTPLSRPSTGTVTAISGSTVTISTTAGTVVAGSIVSAVISVNDKVLIQWDDNGKAWVVGEVGVAASAPATPTGLSLSLDGNTVTATANPSSGATGYRFRFNYGGAWSYVSNDVPVATFGLAQGQTLTVAIQANNTGGSSGWSGSQAISRDAAVKYKTFTTTIQPSDSGTYRNSVNRWNDWNRGRWDFPRALYQGNAYGSGDMTGLAVYGSRIANLGAVEITKATLKLKRNDYAGAGAESAVVRGSTNGSIPGGAPSLTGATVTAPSMGKGSTRTVALSSAMREGLRTGSIKGLALVGPGDAGFYGTGGSMSIEITYVKAV